MKVVPRVLRPTGARGGWLALVLLALAAMGLFAAEATAAPPRDKPPQNEKAVTSETYCAGATPSPYMGGAVYPFRDEQFQVEGARVGRSGCWSGNQFIETKYNLYKWNGSSWAFQSQINDGTWAAPGSYVVQNPGFWDIRGGSYGDYSLNIQYLWWRKNSAGSWVKIGYRTRRFIHSSDYGCAGSNSYHGGTCVVRYIGGRYGTFLWSF